MGRAARLKQLRKEARRQMRAIELKVLTHYVYKESGGPVPYGHDIKDSAVETANFSYRTQLINLLGRTQGNEGFSLGDLRTGLTILKQLDAAADCDTIHVEDAHYEWIKRQLDAARFVFIVEPVLQLLEDIQTAPTVAPAEAKVEAK